MQDWRRWYEGKELTTDWLTKKLESWFKALGPLKDEPVNVLEAGSYEGRSAIAFMEMLPKATLTAIDTFEDPDIEGRFDRNLAPYAGRLTKVKGRAVPALDDLVAAGKIFDVIYLDAGKSRNGTFAQSALAWTLLPIGGLLIWDDVQWRHGETDEEKPASGIRLFQRCFSTCLTVVHDERQLIVRKIEDWPRTSARGF